MKNKAHCYYLMGLANLGFGKKEEANKAFNKSLTYDYNHQNCRIYMKKNRFIQTSTMAVTGQGLMITWSGGLGGKAP